MTVYVKSNRKRLLKIKLEKIARTQNISKYDLSKLKSYKINQ